MILQDQKHLFDIPGNITFLNCSNMSPLLNSVKEAGVQALNKRSHPWRISIDDWFSPAEELRSLFAKIIHGNKENIALVPSVSYGIAVAAKNITIKAGENIIVLDQQYPSNIYAWRELSKATGAEIITVTKELDESWTDVILAKITEQTRLVALPNCHWTNGGYVDLKKVSERVRMVNAILVIDATQSAGAYPLNINEIKPDFLVTAGYKWLLGPYGLGYLYADNKYCLDGNPIEYSWLPKLGSENFTQLISYTDEYKSGARRFDAGEFPSFHNIAMAIAALTQINSWGVENIQETLAILTNAIEERATRLGLPVPKRSNRVGHMIGVGFADEQAAALTKELPVNNIFVSFRGSSMRIAPYLFNNLTDVEKLFGIIEANLNKR